MRAFLSLQVLSLLALTACGGSTGWPLDTVHDVDLPRYMGTWFEIASYPHPVQAGCKNTRAEYVQHTHDALSFEIINSCDRAGHHSEQRGTATVPNTAEPGQLRVSLEVPIIGHVTGEYDIVALDSDYQWAMVGHPSRDYLWILSRTPNLGPAVLAALVVQAEDLGFVDVRKRLRCTTQPGGFEQTCEQIVKR